MRIKHQLVMTTLSDKLICQFAELKYVNGVSIYFEFNKNLKNKKSQSKINRIDFRCDLPNDGKQTIINLLVIKTEGKL